MYVFLCQSLCGVCVCVCVPAVTLCVYSKLCVSVMQNALVSVCGIDA